MNISKSNEENKSVLLNRHIIEEDNISKDSSDINFSLTNYLNVSNGYTTTPKDKSISHRSRSSPIEIYFQIKNQKLKQNVTAVIRLCPLITKLLNNPQSKDLRGVSLVIDLPKEITINGLKQFYSYALSSDLIENENLIDIVIIAEYFENHELANRIIKENITQSLNSLNAVKYLLTSLEKNKTSTSRESISTTSVSDQRNKSLDIWEELTQISKDYLHQHLDIISNTDLIQLFSYDSKLFNNILQKYCFMRNCFYNANDNDNTNSQTKLIKSLEKVYKCDHLLLIIQTLYIKKFSPNQLKELITSTLPIMIELRDMYKEYEINLDEKNKTIIVSTSYNNTEDIYNITINPSNINSCYLYSALYLNDNKEKSSESLLTNFSKWSNYSIKCTYNKHNNANAKKKSKIFMHIKVDYTFTTLINYIIDHLDEYSKQFHLLTCDISLMTQLVFNSKENNINQNIILIAIIDWLNNDYNSTKENIVSLSQHINWHDIKIELITEFYIKYSNTINKTLNNTLIKIFKDNKIEKVISHLAKKIGGSVYTMPLFKPNDGYNEQNYDICSPVISFQFLSNSNNSSNNYINNNHCQGRKTKKELTSYVHFNDKTWFSRGNTYYSNSSSQIGAFSNGKHYKSNSNSYHANSNNNQIPYTPRAIMEKNKMSIFTDLCDEGSSYSFKSNTINKK